MRNKVKVIVSLFLALALLGTLVSCGGKTVPGGPDATDPANPAEDETEEVSTHPGALPVDTELTYNALNYRYAGADDADLPVRAGFGMDTADKTTPEAKIAIYVNGLTEKDGFRFILQTAVDAAFTEEGSKTARVWVHARCESVFLLSVEAYADGAEAYYLYDAAADDLIILGRMQVLRITGNYFLVRRVEENGNAAEIINWQGKTLYVYPNVTDMERWQGDLFLIAGDPARVLRVAEDRFYEESPDFTGAEYCALGDYNAAFGRYSTGLLVLTRKDGGDFRITPLDQAPALLSSLAENPAAGESAITESCDAFSVTLPGFWRGNYDCERTERGLVFSFTGTGGAPVQLFSYTLVEWSDVLDAINTSVVYAEFESRSERLYLVVSAKETYLEDEAQAERYWAMLGSLDAVTESLSPASQDVRYSVFDFADRLGGYTGKTAAGDTYALDLTVTKNNLLMGTLSYNRAAGETGEAEIYVVMYGNMGYLVWQQAEDAQGTGVLRFTDSGALLELRGEAEGWAKTEEFSLKK